MDGVNKNARLQFFVNYIPIFMCKTEVQTFCFFTGGKQEEKKATYEMYVLEFGITFYII